MLLSDCNVTKKKTSKKKKKSVHYLEILLICTFFNWGGGGGGEYIDVCDSFQASCDIYIDIHGGCYYIICGLD